MAALMSQQQTQKGRPLTALAEAVRRFLQHGSDERAYKGEFEFHISQYEEDPRQPPASNNVPTAGGFWRPHPLDLHPPNTKDSEARLQRIIKGEEKLDGHTYHVEPARRQHIEAQVSQLAQTLGLDHCYCLYLARMTQTEESRRWVKSKVHPHAATEESLLPGGRHGERGIDFVNNHVEAMRYLFFIEKRSAMQALLDLVQAPCSRDICKSKLYSVMQATEHFVRQGMPIILMSRIKALTEKNLNGRNDLEIELEMERQKAAECLYFLYYQTPVPAYILLPTEDAPPAAGGSTSGLIGAALQQQRQPVAPTLTGLVHDMAHALSEASRRSDAAGSVGGVGGMPAVGGRMMMMPQAQQQQQAGSMMVVGSGAGGRKHEDNVLFKALVTVAMTVVNALILPDNYPTAGPPPSTSQGGGRSAGLKAWLQAPASEYGAIITELGELKKKNVPDTDPQVVDLKNRQAKAAAEATGRLERVRRHVVEMVQQQGGVEEPSSAFEALIALSLGAFFGDVSKDLIKATRFEVKKYRTMLVEGACRKRVFAFIEGALVNCWVGQSAEEIQSFYLDGMVELLCHYLHQQCGLASPYTSVDSFGQQVVNFEKMESVISLVKRLCEVDIGVTSQTTLLGAFTSSSRGGGDMTDNTQRPEFWLAARLLWTPGGNSWVPVAFVNDVFRHVKVKDYTFQLLVPWLDLLTALASCPAADLKIETVEYLIANTPFNTDIFHFVLEQTIQSQQQGLDTLSTYTDRPLQSILVLIERVTCHALANYPHIDYVNHILPRLYTLSSCLLGEDAKGLLFRALAAFARLPKYARQIWEHLEEIHMLGPLKRELEQEKEGNNPRFPISEGYCILLVDLIRGDIPYDLGETMGQRSPANLGIQPYVDHLIVDIRQAIIAVQSNGTTHPEQTQHYWKILAKVLEAMVLLLQRYPIADGDEDRMRNLGLDHIQRRVAKEEARMDTEISAAQRAPTPGFQLLKRLLVGPETHHSLLRFVVDVITQREHQPAPSFHFLQQQQPQQLSGGGSGCLLLERKNRDRETKALAEAVQVLDALEGGDDKDLKRSRVVAEELAWREQAVKLALELLNHTFIKDRRFADMVKDMYGYRDDADDDSMMMDGGGLGGPYEVLPKELSKRLRLIELLPMVIQYSAYDYNPSLRLQSALLLREWLQRHPQPAEVRNIFSLPGLPEHQLSRTKDSMLKNVLSAGTPVEDYALEFGSLGQALNLLTKIEPNDQEVERLVHYLTLDTLLENLKPLMWTISHVLLGFFHSTDQPQYYLTSSTTTLTGDEPTLPLEAGSMFTLKTIVTNLTSTPSFLISAPLLAEKSMELIYRLCAGKRTTLPTLAFLQSSEIDFFHIMLPLLRHRRPPPREPPRLVRRPDAKSLREYVEYSSLLHLWAWLLKAVAVALYHQSSSRLAGDTSAGGAGGPALLANGGGSATDYSKPVTLFNLLFLNEARGLPRGGGEDPQEGGTLMTDMLNNLSLARDYMGPGGDRPQTLPIVNELLKEFWYMCGQPLPGPSEKLQNPYYVINGDALMTVLRQRLSSSSSSRQQQALQLTETGDEHYVEKAQAYTVQWNHFALRLAGESHFCEAWRRVVETAFISSYDMVIDEQRPEEERLQLVLALMDCAVRKTCKFIHAEATTLRHLSAVALAASTTMWQYSSSRPGLPLSVMDESQGQMTLELLLQGLLRLGDYDEHRPTSSLIFRAHMYTSIILLLRATSLATLPTTDAVLGAGGGGGAINYGGVVVAEPTGEELLQRRRRANAAVLAEERYLPGLVEVLVEDCASSRYEGQGYDSTIRRRWQALAAALLGLVFDTIKGEVDEVSRRPRYPRAIERILLQLPQLLKDVESQFCVETPGPDMPSAAMLRREEEGDGLGGSREGEEYVFRYYMTMLAQLAQEKEGASMLVNHNIVRTLDNVRTFRFRRKTLGGAMQQQHEERYKEMESQVGVVMRLLEMLLTALPRTKSLRRDCITFLNHHEAVLTEFMKQRVRDLHGMEEAGVVVSVLAHSIMEVRDDDDAEGALEAGETGAYPALVYDIFENMSADLLPPFAVDFLRGSTKKSWWAEVTDSEESQSNVQCEPPPGARDNLMWRVTDALKLLASQNLLLRVTTYMRSRLRAGLPYDYIQWERVIDAIRSVIDLLKKQGDGPTPPLPPLSEARRYCLVSTKRQGQAVVLRSGSSKQLVWNYDYLRTSLRHLLGHLLYILYYVIVFHEKPRQRRFHQVKQDIRQRFHMAINGHEDLLLTLEEPQQGGGGVGDQDDWRGVGTFRDPFVRDIRALIFDNLGN